MLMFVVSISYAQTPVDSVIINNDTSGISVPGDSIVHSVDSLSFKKKPKSAVEDPIEYSCTDSLMISLKDKQVFMYGTSKVESQGMNLESYHMRMEMETNTIYAEGRLDTTDNTVEGEPVFKNGDQEFTCKTLKYNFKTKNGFVSDVVTEESDGYLFGETTKMHANNEIHLKNGRYTTCDLDHPHFYLELTRAKVIPGDKIVSGPVYFVILDVPIYLLGLPFGIFPNSKKSHSGIVIPSYGEENRRGFYLRDGGYYFALGDYADLKTVASVYTYGSWDFNVTSRFKMRYKFTGNLDFAYSKNVYGEKEFITSTNSDIKYTSYNSYRLKFNFNQDAKANPTSSLSANISYDKQNYDKMNATDINEYVRSTTTSSVAYQKQLFGGFVNFSTNANMTQNLTDSTLSFSAPTIAISVQKFFPFKRKVQVGKTRWYEKIGTNISANFTNSVDVLADSLLFKPEMYDKMRYGFKYTIPVSTSFNVFKFITVSPSFNYTGRIYPDYVLKYSSNSIDLSGEESNTYSSSYDTISSLRHNFDFSYSVSASTKLYGMFEFKNSKHIKAFRHVISPSVGMSFRPDFSEDRWGYYQLDPTDTTGTKKYCIYQNGVFGTPSSGKQAAITFGLGNNFEMKVKGRKDTIEGQYTKIKLLESLNFSGSYNLAADSMKLSTISMSGGTRLFNKMNITFSGTFDPYAQDSTGRTYDKYIFTQSGGHKLARFTSGRVSTGFSIDSKSFGKNADKNKTSDTGIDAPVEAEVDEFGNIIATAEEVQARRTKEQKEKKESQQEDVKKSEYGYYECPWSFSCSYGFNYSHAGAAPAKITQTLNFNGSVKFTDKWNLTFNSGYDFDAKKMTSTRLSVSRDLHCFNLSFYIIPFGRMKSYNFTLAFNSSLFQGVEYKRQQSWRDN